MIGSHLKDQGLSELVLEYITSRAPKWPMDLKRLTAKERQLFNIGVLSLVGPDSKAEDSRRLVQFTSGLIYRICLHLVPPNRQIRVSV